MNTYDLREIPTLTQPVDKIASISGGWWIENESPRGLESDIQFAPLARHCVWRLGSATNLCPQVPWDINCHRHGKRLQIHEIVAISCKSWIENRSRRPGERDDTVPIQFIPLAHSQSLHTPSTREEISWDQVLHISACATSREFWAPGVFWDTYCAL